MATGADRDGGHRLVERAVAGSPLALTLLYDALMSRDSAASSSADDLLDTLAVRAAAGDRPAVELLLEVVHRLGLARPAIAAVVQGPIADDVAQLTLIRVEDRIRQYERRARFRTWLYTVARNEALMVLRSRRTTPLGDVTYGADRSGGSRLSSVVATRETIASVVDSLPGAYSEALRLRLYEELDYEQIAQRLGIPVGTVRSRLAKARELMAQRLEH